MEKLVHQPTGSLVPDDPFLVLGTTFRYKPGRDPVSSKNTDYYATVTEESIKCQSEELDNRVWGIWRRDGNVQYYKPQWAFRDDVEVIRVGGNQTNT